MSLEDPHAARRAIRRAGRPVATVLRSVRRWYELRQALQTIRRSRGVRLVLMYHRVAPRAEPRYEVVPTVPLGVFRDHLTALGDVGRLVPLSDLLDDSTDDDEATRFALTFDDDYHTHDTYVLPVLREFGVHGTFFLSGRALHGLGAYWFEQLEALVLERGVATAAALLELPDVTVEARLALACEGDIHRQKLIARHAPEGRPPLSASGISRLVEAGMNIGFHTLHHPVLPTLDEAGQRQALSEGRDALEALIGGRVEWLAYPHGKADERTVRIADEEGYSAAWTTQPRVLGRHDNRFEYGRWEPFPLSATEMLIRLGRFLESRTPR